MSITQESCLQAEVPPAGVLVTQSMGGALEELPSSGQGIYMTSTLCRETFEMHRGRQ